MSSPPLAPEPPPPISIEEIEHSPTTDLRKRIDEWFAYLKVCGYEQKPGVVAQAEFYMRELERRENAAVAERDFGMAKRSHTMEIWVIILIGLELLAAGVSLWYSWHEGEKQQTVLTKMQENSQSTADTLKVLSDDQKSSLDAQGKTNTNLQAMANSLAKQLKIIQREQDEHIAAQSRRPELEMWTTNRVSRYVPGIVPGLTFRNASAGLMFRRPDEHIPNDEKVILRRNSANPTLVETGFFIRNIGNTPAQHVTITPLLPTGISFVCLEFPTELLLDSLGQRAECPTMLALSATSVIPIPPRPRKEPIPSLARFGNQIEEGFDFSGRLKIIVPVEIEEFQIEFTLTTDGIDPVRKTAYYHFVPN